MRLLLLSAAVVMILLSLLFLVPAEVDRFLPWHLLEL